MTTFMGLATLATGDFHPIVKFDGRAGRFFKEGEYDPAASSKNFVDITMPPPVFAWDFGTFEIGYLYISPSGPDFKMVPAGQTPPERPAELRSDGKPAYRPGFRVGLFGKVLDGYRQFSHTALCVLEPVQALWDEFCASPEAAAGRIPIVKLAGTVAATRGKGQRVSTNYRPVFEIVEWTERVPEMGVRTVPPPQPRSVPPVVTPPVEMPAQKMPEPARAMAGSGLVDDEIPFAPCWQ